MSPTWSEAKGHQGLATTSGEQWQSTSSSSRTENTPVTRRWISPVAPLVVGTKAQRREEGKVGAAQVDDEASTKKPAVHAAAWRLPGYRRAHLITMVTAGLGGQTRMDLRLYAISPLHLSQKHR